MGLAVVLIQIRVPAFNPQFAAVRHCIFGVFPDDYHPYADKATEEQLRKFLQDIQSSIQKEVSQQPSHRDFVDKYCSAANMS